LNSKNLNARDENPYYSYYQRIQEIEVKKTLKKMTNGKEVESNNISIEV